MVRSAHRPPKADRSLVSDSTLTLRLTGAQRALLDELVKLRSVELADEGLEMTAAAYVRGLITRDAKAKGLDVASPKAASRPRAAKGGRS